MPPLETQNNILNKPESPVDLRPDLTEAVIHSWPVPAVTPYPVNRISYLVNIIHNLSCLCSSMFHPWCV